jgi:acylphosphatase
MAKTCVHLIISGEVQGVCYRASARDEAERLGVVGWVRNLPDGNVEAEVEGPEELVAEFIQWCWKGPPASVVSDVKAERAQPSGQFRRFGILR